MKIIYEDNHIIVVVKAPGELSQGDETKDDDMVSMLKVYLKEKYNKPGNVFLGLVHRIDRPVGGLMVFARTSKAASRLSDQIRKNTIDKGYLAIVKGSLEKEDGKLIDYLVKDRNTNISRVASKDEKNAKKAILEYETVAKNENESMVKINLITGRAHQIRVQFSSRGNSLVGDVKYGDGKGHHTVALWAYRLSFEHPTKKERLTFVEMPENKGVFAKFKDYEKNISS